VLYTVILSCTAIYSDTSGTPINILHGICMVYTIHIHCILNCSFVLVSRILSLGTHAMGVYKAMYTPKKKKKHIHPSNAVNMNVW
jgi:hypothetical protein